VFHKVAYTARSAAANANPATAGVLGVRRRHVELSAFNVVAASPNKPTSTVAAS
jgi:hypothetical protein